MRGYENIRVNESGCMYFSLYIIKTKPMTLYIKNEVQDGN